MTVEVELFANLAAYLPPHSTRGRASLGVPEGSTVGDVLRVLGIPEAMPRIVLVNGHEADADHRLTGGDALAIFPPLAGGE